MTIHDRRPSRPCPSSPGPTAADAAPDRETWVVSVYDADGTDAFAYDYYLDQAEAEVYDSILYLRGGSLEHVELHVSLILGNGTIWVAMMPVPGAADYDDGSDLPPAYALRHGEQRSHAHRYRDAGGHDRHGALRLTVAARCLSSAHGAVHSAEETSGIEV